MWRDGVLCDDELLVSGRSFHAHRNLLAAESPYLMALVTTIVTPIGLRWLFRERGAAGL